MWVFLFLSGLTSDVDACAWGSPECRVGGANELGKAWVGTALLVLDPLFEQQQVHSTCAWFQAAKAGSSRVRVENSAAEVQSCCVGPPACRAQGQGRV